MGTGHRLIATSSAATRIVFAACILASSGCATTFKETHYFQSLDPIKKTPTNYYRLQVSGYGSMTSARYVSGYYDQRAVDFFFNEVKVSETSSNDASSQKLFPSDQKIPGSEELFKPLDPTKENGAFVMILSTNASSVTRTIGQFAENQVVADAVTNLANREAILRGRSVALAMTSRANATADELEKVMERLPAGSSPDKVETRRSLLRVLNSIATGLGDEPTDFKTIDEAHAWFRANSIRRSTQ